MNETPSGDRVHIAFFGRRNAGKSSIVNAVAGQRVSIVSDVKGTTTDPVSKAMEIPPLGPVVLFDTPGFDDSGELGSLRVERTKRIFDRCDAAVLVVDRTERISKEELDFIAEVRARNLPCILAWSKCDLTGTEQDLPDTVNVYTSALTGRGIEELKNILSKSIRREIENPFVSDLISNGDTVVLVTPIDASAPKGRLILPQQQVIRDLVDAGACTIVCRESVLEKTLSSLKELPRMVITDSQVFKKVNAVLPPEIPLTSFSILMARKKGTLEASVKGTLALDTLNDGDRVLVSEGCTHHRQCEDIGTVKMPRWISDYTNKKIQFEFSSGNDFPEDLARYKLVIHCGGCMLNPTEMKNRITRAVRQGVPVTNYGMAIAHMNGILKRSLDALKRGDE